MKLLTAEQIFGADDMRYEDVPTPEWGPDSGIRVRRLGAGERRAFELSTGVNDTDFDLRTALVAACACDEEFKPLFTREQMKKLSEKDAAPIVRAFAVCKRLNGMDDDAEKKSPSSEAGNGSV